MFDVFTYRKIVLNTLPTNTNKKYIIIKNKDYIPLNIPNYIIRDNEYVIGYNIDTVNGLKYMPVFSHNLGRLKNKMNSEFILKYKEYITREKNRKINTLYTIGLPYELCELTYNFIK